MKNIKIMKSFLVFLQVIIVLPVQAQMFHQTYTPNNTQTYRPKADFWKTDAELKQEAAKIEELKRNIEVIPLKELGTGTFLAEGPQDKENFLRIVTISDTHGKHDELSELPEGDILIHAGDFTMSGELKDVESFRTFLEKQLKDKFKHIVFIAGNHEVTLQSAHYQKVNRQFHVPRENDRKIREIITENLPSQIHYLEDKAIEIEGLKIYGAPWVPAIPGDNRWAFSLHQGGDLAYQWRQIPKDTDLLITHGPPKFHGDCQDPLKDPSYGCSELLKEVLERVQPYFHVFGHMHEGYGVVKQKGVRTHFVNASTCDEHYQPIRKPIVFDIPRKKKD